MLPYISLYGYKLSVYGVCMATAFLVCLYLFSRRMKRIGCCFEQSTVMTVVILLSALAGAYLLHRLISIADQNSKSEDLGFVLYGGIITGSLGCFVICKMYGYNTWKILDEIAAIVPLGQGIGRIGCFAVGCCYGKQTSGFPYVIYTHQEARAPLYTPLIPVQLYEAVFDLILFLFLYFGFWKDKPTHSKALLYLSLYTSFRFFIEFFRGDAVRGIWGGLSTSQWISLSFLPMILFLFFRIRKHSIHS